MTELTIESLARRVAKLERQVKQLAPGKDWRLAVGMFAGSEIMKEINAAGQAIREADRAAGSESESD